METIIVVDDSRVFLHRARKALEDKYQVLTTLSAVKMFELIAEVTPDLILLDIHMPEMDGFAVIEKLKKDERTARIPVVFLTSSTDEAIEARGFELGAVDYVTKPFSSAVLLNRIATHLHIDGLIKKRTKRIERLKNSTLSVIADMVESRDKVTGGHIERTSGYIRILIDAMNDRSVYAEEMALWDFDTIVSSARMHDVGKIAISDLILNKPGKLTPEEMETMRTHVSEGEMIINRIIAKVYDGDGEGEEDDTGAFLQHAKTFAGYHHERWDGSGYPYGLKGLNIPLQGRIMAIADVYDALVSARPYKVPFSCEQANKIIERDSGTAFDPALASVFLKIKDAFALVVNDGTQR